MRISLIQAMGAALGVALLAQTALAAEPTLAELQAQIAELTKKVEQLAQANAGGDAASLAALQKQIESLSKEIERLKLGEAASEPVADPAKAVSGLGPAASKIYQKSSGVSIGGYGEMVYQNFAKKNESDGPSGKYTETDFLRAIVYVGYKFSDKWLLNTEFEFEHATTSRKGEVSVEFAYLDYMAHENFNLRFGMLLVPMGLVNEFHEPTLFYSVNRPATERQIIPSTWRENGLGFYGDYKNISYRFYVVNGMDGKAFGQSGLRDGRQKGGNALAEDLAATGRFDWEITPGVTTGVSFYYGESDQDLGPKQKLDLSTAIFDWHFEAAYKGLRVRALAAMANLGDVRRFNTLNNKKVAEQMFGGYLEVGYDVLSLTSVQNQALIPFVRYEVLNTQAGMPEGFEALEEKSAYDQTILTGGIAYKPLPQLVFKGDFQLVSNEAETGVDQFNLGLGYIF